MFGEDLERDARRWEIFNSLPTKKAHEYLEQCNRYDRLERSIDSNSRGWFQPTEIFKGWLFAKFLMIGLPILVILVGLFNKELVDHNIFTRAELNMLSEHLGIIMMLGLLYHILLKWMYQIKTRWVMLGVGVIMIINPPHDVLADIVGWFIMLTVVLFMLTVGSKIFSKK